MRFIDAILSKLGGRPADARSELERALAARRVSEAAAARDVADVAAVKSRSAAQRAADERAHDEQPADEDLARAALASRDQEHLIGVRLEKAEKRHASARDARIEAERALERLVGLDALAEAHRREQATHEQKERAAAIVRQRSPAAPLLQAIAAVRVTSTETIDEQQVAIAAHTAATKHLAELVDSFPADLAPEGLAGELAIAAEARRARDRDALLVGARIGDVADAIEAECQLELLLEEELEATRARRKGLVVTARARGTEAVKLGANLEVLAGEHGAARIERARVVANPKHAPSAWHNGVRLCFGLALHGGKSSAEEQAEIILSSQGRIEARRRIDELEAERLAAAPPVRGFNVIRDGVRITT